VLYLRPAKEPERNQPIDWPQRLANRAGEARDSRLQKFYRAGTVRGDTPLASTPFVALDFETTGLDVEQHGIVSVGLIPFDLRRIRCAQARHWVVKPRKALVEESITYHGITHSDIQRAPDLSQVLDEILEALAGRVVVVHYRAIERRFLDAALQARIGEGIEFPVVDTLELEALAQREVPRGWLTRLRGHRRPSVRLADSRLRYGLPYYAPHHALTDALATAELFQAQVAHHYSPTTPVAELWR